MTSTQTISEYEAIAFSFLGKNFVRGASIRQGVRTILLQWPKREIGLILTETDWTLFRFKQNEQLKHRVTGYQRTGVSVDDLSEALTHIKEQLAANAENC
jgi:hypothetical protein